MPKVMTIFPRSDADKAVQMLRDQADVVLDPTALFYPRPSPDLRHVAFIPYYLEPSQPNLSQIVLIPVIDGVQSEGVLGVEIISPDNRIICQTTVPLSQVKSYLPVHLNFHAIPDSHQGVFELRIFTRNAMQPVHVLENRFFLLSLLGLRRWRTSAVCGMIFGVAAEKEVGHVPQVEDNDAWPSLDNCHTNGELNIAVPSLMNIKDGVWCVLDFPQTAVVSVEQGVLSLRGWAWSRELGPGKLFVEIQESGRIERRPIQHRYCRLDVSQAIPEIPLDNYAGFEISLDRFDLPVKSTVTLVTETPAMAYRLSPISVSVAHSNRITVLQDVACDCCNSIDLTEVGKKDGLTIRRCRNCGLVMTSPRPDFSRIRQRYSENYFEQEYMPHIHANLEEARKHWNSILDIMERYKKISPYLFEVGTGAGYLLKEATQRGWVASGIDLNSAAVRHAQGLGLDVTDGDILDVHLPSNKFGAILFESVIEHFLSPRQVLAKCVQALRPGGGISIETISNEGDLFMTQGMDFRYVGPSEHLYYFPASALIRLCESVGLRVERFWRDSTGDSVALWATKRIDRWS
jgi:SAM-dependent methyltransferase